jgi:hypothetical protein
MKYPQPAPGEDRDDPFFYVKGSEKAFAEFLRQLHNKQARGFISEGEHGKVFSFETYLRETGHDPKVINGYCKHATAVNLLEKTASKARGFGIIFEKGFFKGLLVIIGIVFSVMLLIYLLGATLLLVFGVSLWNVSDFFYITVIGTVVGLVFIFLKAFIKGKNNNAKGTHAAPPIVVKYFDNDELTFTKAKSRLFVEK